MTDDILCEMSFKEPPSGLRCAGYSSERMNFATGEFQIFQAEPHKGGWRARYKSDQHPRWTRWLWSETLPKAP